MLTSEQKQRIEENRKKALLLRAQRNHQLAPPKSSSSNQNFAHSSDAQKTFTGPACGSDSNFSKASANQQKSYSAFGSSHTFYTSSSNKKANQQSVKSLGNSSQVIHHKPAATLLSTTTNKPLTNKQFTSTNLWQNYSVDKDGDVADNSAAAAAGNAQRTPVVMKKMKAIRGLCVLVNRTRFEVVVTYHEALIAICKAMKTKQYDPVTKRWSIELKEYNEFMSKVKTLDGVVELEPLPKAVLTTFANELKGRPLPANRIPEADLGGIDEELTSTLMPFQKQGVNFAVWREGRVLIADDMGLGKTIQALCIAAYYRKEWPLLVVVPSSVRFAWAEQVRKWLPSVPVDEITVSVTGKDSVTGLVNIMSYDLMVRKIEQLKKRNFQIIIMDESHFLKNNKTARTQAAFPLLKNALRVILLSGTPALSRPAELFTQLTLVDGKVFPKFHDFGVRYCAGKQMPWGWDFTGSSNLEELQIVLEERVMIRRLKKDVLSQLPAKQRQVVIIDPQSVKIGKDLKASAKLMEKVKSTERRGALLQYFHETGSAKISAINEYVGDLLEGDSKFLVFAHHQEVLNSLETMVTKKKIKYIRIDGSTTPEQRNFFCSRFQLKDEYRVAILSITAANAGLNLTAAKLVVFAELFWNPGILLQAEDRAHRIGQDDSVLIHYLVAKGTADDHIWPMVQNKLDILSKAGLNKDDFTEADTKHIQNNCEDILDETDAASMENNSTILEYFTKKEAKPSEEKVVTTEDFSDVPDDFFNDIDEETDWEPPQKKSKNE